MFAGQNPLHKICSTHTAYTYGLQHAAYIDTETTGTCMYESYINLRTVKTHTETNHTNTELHLYTA